MKGVIPLGTELDLSADREHLVGLLTSEGYTNGYDLFPECVKPTRRKFNPNLPIPSEYQTYWTQLKSGLVIPNGGLIPCEGLIDETVAAHDAAIPVYDMLMLTPVGSLDDLRSLHATMPPEIFPRDAPVTLLLAVYGHELIDAPTFRKVLDDYNFSKVPDWLDDVKDAI